MECLALESSPAGEQEEKTGGHCSGRRPVPMRDKRPAGQTDLKTQK